MRSATSDRSYRIGLFVILVVGLALGFPGMRWLSLKKFSKCQDELLADATALSRAITVERIRKLTNTRDDANTPECKRVCEQLRAFVPKTRFRAVYFVVKRGGVYFFGPSSCGDKTPMSVAPGTPYLNPPPELADAFKSRLPQEAGPLTDERGTFMYAMIPFVDPQTNDVLMVLVAMVDGSSWVKGFVRLWVGPVGFALGFIGIILVGFFLLRWYGRHPKLRHGLLSQGEMILTALIGMTFALTVAWMARDAEKLSRRSNFVSLSQAQASGVATVMFDLRNRLSSLSQALAGEPHVTLESFGRNLSPHRQSGIVDAWLWVPAVQPSRVREVESQAHQEGLSGFAMLDRNENGDRISLGKRDLYCPVLYIEPASWSKSWAGYDISEHPLLRPALECAASSGLTCSSDALPTLSKPDDSLSVFVFEPVFGREKRDRSLRGFIVAVVRPACILRQSFVAFDDTTSPDLTAEIYQLRADHAPQFLGASVVLQQPMLSKALGFTEMGEKRLRATIPLFLFGKSYAMVVKAGPAYFKTHSLWIGKMAAFSGSLLTVLLTGFVGLLTRRRVSLEAQIQSRTLELERVSQQIVTIMDSAADGILGLDTAGNHTVVNVSAAQMLGYPINELIGQPSYELWNRMGSNGQPCHEEDCPVYTTYKYGTEHRKSDTVFWRKDGTSFRAAFVSKPLYQQGSLVGAVITFRDITEQMATEENLKKAYDELSRMNTALQEASQVKSQFLAHMSHEIRTPLNCVIGMTGLLLNTRLEEEQQEFAETIRVSGENLLAVVNEILDYSKIEAQKMELEKQPFELRHCIEDALDLVASAAAMKKLELTYLINEKLHSWWIGDATRIRQIIVNLLSNAVKFTNEGEVDLSVSGQPVENGNYLLSFCIKDTGVGIPPERADRLFQSFSQVDVSTTRRFGGTGLGLAISKRLCELMGGGISVESSGVPGQGSTFRFTVQLEPDYSLHAEIERAVASVALGGKKVLLVEHNASTRETLVRQLEALGVSPVVVDCATLALEKLRAADLFESSEVFDVAVIDSQISVSEGVPLGAEIRKIPGREMLPLVLLSPLGAHVGANVEAGCIAHVTKPVKLSLLYEAIVKAVSLRPATRRIATVKRNQYDGEMGRNHPLRILLAEDNVVNQKVATRILSKIGYRADVVSNGLEALDAVKRTPYDVVFMDVQMPEMDGEQATIRIRQELLAEKQPWIIAMTANAMSGDRERYQAAGMNDYVPKPIRVERLIEILRTVQPSETRTGLSALAN
jgi:PAS domain S-box-containing protein